MTIAAEPLPAAPTIEYRWAMKALDVAIARRTPEVLCYGPRGVGKTLCLCDYLHRLAMQYPGMRQLWARSSRARMTDSVLWTFETEILPMWGMSFGEQGRDHRRSYVYPNGSETILQGMDDPERQKSVQADIVWVNEPSEISSEQWEELGGSLRPSMRSACPIRLKIGDHNPMPAAHWTNTRCEHFPEALYPRVLDDGTRMGDWLTFEMYCRIQEYNLDPIRPPHLTKKIVFVGADNPGYWSLDPWGWTADGLEYARNQLGRMTGHRKARYLEGRPVAAEGSVFPEFAERNECDPFPNGWPEEWPAWVAYDPGYDHPCAVVFLGVAPNGQFHIFEEIHGREINLDTLGPMIRKKAEPYRVVAWLDDPRGANQRRQESNGKTVRDIMRDTHRLFFRPWQAAEGAGKQAQVEAVRMLLLADKPLVVWKNCRGVIGEFQSWSYKRNARGEMLGGDDAYEDRNNDAIDAICGIVAANPNYDQPDVEVYNNP